MDPAMMIWRREVFLQNAQADSPHGQRWQLSSPVKRFQLGSIGHLRPIAKNACVQSRQSPARVLRVTTAQNHVPLINVRASVPRHRRTGGHIGEFDRSASPAMAPIVA